MGKSSSRNKISFTSQSSRGGAGGKAEEKGRLKLMLLGDHGH